MRRLRLLLILQPLRVELVLNLTGAEQQPDSWWQLCKTTIRQGLVEEADQWLREQLAALLRVHTSRQGSALTSLDAYLDRASAEQTSILWLAGACCCLHARL